MKNVANVFVGVDVSKLFLDICLYPKNLFFKVKNNDDGIEKFFDTLSSYEIERVAFESSGGYENLLLDHCQQAGYAVWQIDPKLVKAFIISEGVKAKTDKIDAKMIALFASKKEPRHEKMAIAENQKKLRALVQRRDALVAMSSMEKKRLNGPMATYCKVDIEEMLKIFADSINAFEVKIQKIIAEDSKMRQRKEILESIPGIGSTTAASLIAHMPELGDITNKQAAALIGVAPYSKQSGMYQGNEMISGGRFAPRCALYMAALSACRYNPVMKHFYGRLRCAGKKPKIAVVAVMNKLICTINAMCTKNTKWVYLPIS